MATRANHRPIWPLIVMTFGLVLLPAIGHVLRPEIGRWHLALASDHLVDTSYFGTEALYEADVKAKAAHLAKRKQSLAKAEAEIAEASKWGGKTADYYAISARIHRAKGQYIQEFSDMKSAALKSPRQYRWLHLSNIGGVALRRSNLAEAIEFSSQALKLADEQDLYTERAELLNQIAYARAIAGVDLDKALENIDESLEIYQSSAIQVPTQVDSYLIQLRDTRGFILFRLGKTEKAREEFDLIWLEFEDWFKEEQQRLAEKKRQRIDIRHFKGDQLTLLRSLAVIMYHRSLVLNSDDKKEAREIRDLEKRIKALNFTPGPGLF